MDILIKALEFINQLAIALPWEIIYTGLTMIGTAIVASGILTPVTVALKKHSQLFKMALVYGALTLGAVVHYLTTTPTVSPELVPLQSALLFVMAQPFYLKWWQPLAVKFAEQWAKAKAFDEEVKSAAVPYGGIPGVTAPAETGQSTPVINDFR